MFLHSAITASANLWLPEPPPDMPELGDVHIESLTDRDYLHGRVTTEIRFSLKDGGARQLQILKQQGVRIAYCSISAYIDLPAFWRKIPEDCIGATLGVDGYVSYVDSGSGWRIVPLDQPEYIQTRPIADTEHGSPKAYYFGGGMPLASKRLIAALRALGAEGETAPVIYRGCNKAKYDTVQPGLQRFDLRPVHELPATIAVDVWPPGLSEEFGVCALERFRANPESLPPSARDHRWREVAVDMHARDELRRQFRGLLFEPIFRHGGATHMWFKAFEDEVAPLMIPA